MKKIHTLLLALLFCAGSLFANPAEESISIDSRNLRNEVQALFSRSPIHRQLKSDVIVRVECTVNQDNELIVLRTDSADDQFQAYIQRSLNFLRIEKQIQNKESKFIVPIRFQKK